MKIAILGGGFAGLTAAHYLRQKDHDVTIFERESVLGGLAAGFTSPGWEWPLERAYHHLFTNDTDILQFAKEIGFNDFLYKSPITASLYKVEDNYRIFPVDSPQDLLKFPLMSVPARLRTGMVAALFKFLPNQSIYERETAAKLLRKLSGEESWRVFWEPLLRKKFGKYAEKVVASFIWARINKRTPSLVYIKGGFQTLLDHIENKLKENKVRLLTGNGVESITKKGEKFNITYAAREKPSQSEEFDVVISTLPTVIMSKVTSDLFPVDYLDRFKKLEYMSAVNLILETTKPILDKTYWLSCCVKEFPFLVTLQHTNLIDKKHYGGKHILYIGNYVDMENKLLKMNKEETLEYLLPDVKKFSANEIEITNSFHFKAGFAQPIFDRKFVENKPDFETPVKNFFIANLDMTYPYDRGTNYAVALGKKVCDFVSE